MTTKYRFTFIAGLLLVLSSSCKKGWLDTTSSAEIRTEDQFSNEAGFKDALMGVYIGMTDPGLYSRNMTWNLVDLLSQQYNTLTTLAQFADVQQFRYRSVRAMPNLDAMWARSYNVIANINNALSYIDKNKSVLHSIQYSIIKGELLGLRAMLHFDLMRLYGYGNLGARAAMLQKPAIPYVTKFSKEATQQLNYTQTFALLEKDLADALELLKEDPLYKAPNRPANYYDMVNRDGFYNKREQRMNYYAVRALQARVYSWQGTAEKLTQARVAAEEVISQSHAKLITPATSPASDRLLYSEHIFNLNVTAFTTIIGSLMNAELATNYDALFLLPQTAQALYETSNARIGLVDKRYTTLLETQSRGMVSVKLAQRNGGVQNIMPLIRVSEMYYIVAESYIGTDLPKAIEYLNMVRSSRGILDPIPGNIDEAAVKAELMKEYRKEFISEGQLFFFYKRTGQTTIPGYSGTGVDDKIYVLPYPDSEIEFGNRNQ